MPGMSSNASQLTGPPTATRTAPMASPLPRPPPLLRRNKATTASTAVSVPENVSPHCILASVIGAATGQMANLRSEIGSSIPLDNWAKLNDCLEMSLKVEAVGISNTAANPTPNTALAAARPMGRADRQTCERRQPVANSRSANSPPYPQMITMLMSANSRWLAKISMAILAAAPTTHLHDRSTDLRIVTSPAGSHAKTGATTSSCSQPSVKEPNIHATAPNRAAKGLSSRSTKSQYMKIPAKAT